jgi:purine-binding chemotaxis protein CheW
MEQLMTSAGTAQAVETSGEMLHLVTFKLGPEEFAVDILLVQEIDRNVEITKVPRAPDFVKGVINLRGKIVPVLDLRKRFGLRWQEFTGASRIVVVNVESRTLGLTVDSVSEVLRTPVDSVKPHSSMVTGLDVSHIKGVVKLDGRLLIVLDLQKVLSAKEIGNLAGVD